MLPDERKRSTIIDRWNLFNFLAKDASKQRDGVNKVGCLQERCSAGVEETRNVQN